MELLGKDEEVWLWRRFVTRAGCEVSKAFFYPQCSLPPASGLRRELLDVLASTGSARIQIPLSHHLTLLFMPNTLHHHVKCYLPYYVYLSLPYYAFAPPLWTIMDFNPLY